MSGEPERHYWLQRGIGPEGPYTRQTIVDFIDRGLRVADVARDSEPEWTALESHPDFAPAVAAARRARDAPAHERPPAEPERKPGASARVPASHPDVVAFLDRGVRTGPTLRPKVGLMVLGTLELAGLSLLAVYDVGALAVPAFLLALIAFGLYARSTIVLADRRGLGRLGWRRSWEAFDTLDVEPREVRSLSRRGTVTDERTVVVTRFRFRGGPDLRVTTDAMTHTRELTRYAEIVLAARRDRIPESRLEKLRATAVSPKPSLAFPVVAFSAFLLLATPITLLALVAPSSDARPEQRRASAPAPRPVAPEPVPVAPPSLGALTFDGLQRRARAAGYEALDLSPSSDGLSLVATAEHRRSTAAAPRRFRLHFFDLEHPPSTGEPPPDDCRLFDEHVVCVRGPGSSRLLETLDPAVTLDGLPDALEEAGHRVTVERDPQPTSLVETLLLEVGEPAAPILLRGASWQRAMEDRDEDTAAAVRGSQAMVVRKTGALDDAATFLEQLTGIER